MGWLDTPGERSYSHDVTLGNHADNTRNPSPTTLVQRNDERAWRMTGINT